MMDNRVCFYSPNDLSIGYNLELAEKAIIKYKSEPASTLTDVIELFHIKKLIDNDCRLKCWSDIMFNQIKEDIKNYNDIIAKHFAKLNRDSLENCYDALSCDYRQAFWDIIDQFKLFNVIDNNFVKYIAKGKQNDLTEVLHCRNVVEKFKIELRQIMLEDSNTAHILINHYIAKHDNITDRRIHLPSNLSMDDKVKIINSYLDSKDPNLNYVRLICQNKDDKNGLVLDPKTKVKAERLAQKLNDEFMSDSRTVNISHKLAVAFSNENNITPTDYRIEGGYPTYLYSIKYIRSCNSIELVENCKTLFYWINRHGLLELINKSGEIDGLEIAFMDKSKNAYPDYSYFHQKNDLALYQICGYNNVLAQLNMSFEQTLKEFYEVHLFNKYGYPALKLNYPNIEDSWLNKCRILFPELDSVVKQYNTYVQYDEIDKDIIRLSKPLKMTEGKSLLLNKYYEINEESSEIRVILNCIFGSNTLLGYVKPFKEKHYHNLFDLLNNEEVYYEFYEEYQKTNIDFLLSHDVIKKSKGGQLSIPDNDFKIILKSLWEYRACSYWHYSEKGMKYLDEMLNKGWLIKSDNLLTKEEKRYFSYYMDNGEFTNGHAYRNLYAHGCIISEDDTNKHHIAYLVFLRLLTILILKIEDDLQCATRALLTGIVSHISSKLNC